MTGKKILTILALISSVIIILFLLIDYLSLHDIQNDYVSQSILESLGIKTSNELPVWTGAELEWLWIRISFSGKLLLAMFNVYLLFRLVRGMAGKGVVEPTR